MISLSLIGLAVLWLAFLRRYPWLFARMRRRVTSAPHYHYYVGGIDELPTWRRQSPKTASKTPRGR